MADSPADRLYRIVEQGLCIGCGLCQSVAGLDRIRVTRTRGGYEQPVVTGELDHDLVDRIYDVCPGTRIDGLPEVEIGPRTRADNVWGPWLRMVRAWATDTEVRYEGSTGGVLSALAEYLLSSDRVRFILHVRASATAPTFGERHLSFNRADILSAAGSRYGPAAPLIDVADVLDRGEPFAFIGKPCDIAALRNLARYDGRVDELVRYRLTPVCGGYMPPASMDAFMDRVGVDPAAVTAMRYRGRGCPGPTVIETADRTVRVHYLDLWGEDSSMWSLPFRCKICPDGIGEAADIAASDTWPGGSPDRETSVSDPGTNAIIVRTQRGLELLEAAVSDGALTVEYDVAPDEMSHYQPHQMHRKYAVWGRLEGLRAEGRIVPKTGRLRLEELASELPEAFSARQREGTRRRVREGRADQEKPEPA